jgi:broad specificity phosphatase PhoE
VSTLILVKHSLPEIIENIPAREWKLSAEGRARCKRLAERLAHYAPERLISSLEPKARETSELVAKELDVSTNALEGLHEHDRSDVGYLSRDEFQEAVRKFFAHPDTLVFGSETADQAHQRFQAAIHSVLSQFADQTIGIVAHGTVISLFVSRLTGLSDLTIWKELGLPSYVVLDMGSKSLLARENIRSAFLE